MVSQRSIALCAMSSWCIASESDRIADVCMYENASLICHVQAVFLFCLCVMYFMVHYEQLTITCLLLSSAVLFLSFFIHVFSSLSSSLSSLLSLLFSCSWVYVSISNGSFWCSRILKHTELIWIFKLISLSIFTSFFYTVWKS